MRDAAQDVEDFPTLTPAAGGPGDPVVNIRTEYGYDVDGNLTGILMPRAFQSGTVATPDPVWTQRFDYEQRGLAVRSHRAQDPNQAGTCATGCGDEYGPGSVRVRINPDLHVYDSV